MPTDQELNTNPFGTGQSWPEVVQHIGRLLRSKVPWLRQNPDILEDVLSSVQLDLLEYWTTLASAKNAEGYYYWGGAVQRGVWFGSREAWNSLPNQVDFQSIGPIATMDDEYDEEEEMYRIAHEVLSSFSYEELQEFFEGILGNTTTREAAAVYGVSHMTVARRRQAQREKLRQRAREMGLLDA